MPKAHDRLALVHKDILGLEVAMHHLPAMGIVERAGDRRGDTNGLVDPELLLALDALPQRLACDIRHHIEQQPRDFSRVKQRQQMWMLQIRGDADLSQKALDAQHGAELGAQHLERHLAVVPQVVGEVDGRHPAGPDLSIDAIPLTQARLESLSHVHEIRDWGRLSQHLAHGATELRSKFEREIGHRRTE
ncbi:MAG: hypothetical protein IPF87_18270 [Gemmatimonadetes bacterium]|nr:hypothetical protein [Gemmatimonadota bacterium]